MIFKINKDVTHQEIGGKKFVVDTLISNGLDRRVVFDRALEGNPACFNFINRRKDLFWHITYDEMLSIKTPKLYYGHVDNLGYIIAEDEVEHKDGDIVNYELINNE